MNNRIIAFIGAALLIIGTFLPLVSVSVGAAGLSQSASFLGSGAGTKWPGIILILLAVASIGLAVVRKYKFLILTGVLALGIVVYNFIDMKSSMAKAMGDFSSEQLERMGVSVDTQWIGWIVLILGSLALIAAGAMKAADAVTPNWGGAQPPPPPPPPYTPGR